MKLNKLIFRGTCTLTIIIFLLIALPISTALAYTDGPNNPGQGSNVSGVGTMIWQNPGNITAPGTPYATVTLNKTDRYSNYLQATDYGFAIPADANINGITVHINRQSDHNNPSILDNVVSLVKGGNIIGENKKSATAWPSSMGTAIYGGATDLWGTSWTPADINSKNFGVILAAYRQNNGNNDRIAIVDYMQVSVYYTYNTRTTVSCADGTTYGSNLTCEATVTRVGGDQTPSGLVNWTTDDSGTFVPNPCTLSGSVGVATCSVTYTPTAVGDGSHLITANYGGDSYFAPSSGNQMVGVFRKVASVNPNAASKIYGDADPTLTGTLTGFLPTDSVSATYHRTPGETVLGSPYSISGVLSPTDVLSNYDITYNTSDFTIDPRSASVSPDAASKAYGDVDPTLIGTLEGFLFADNVTATYSRVAGETVAGSPYIISAGLSPEAVLSNYDIIYNTAGFTINKAGASCTATGYDVTYDGNPHIATGSCVGVKAETLSGLDLSGTTHTNAGVYAKDPWTFTDATGNYNNTSGTVDNNIGKAAATCVVTPYKLEYDRNEHTASGICTGVKGKALLGLDLTGTAHTEIGIYTIDPWVFTDATGNYTDVSGSVKDEITLRFITVTADAKSKVVGQPDPTPTYHVTVGSLLSGDSFTGELTRDAGESVGTYAIRQGNLALLPAYYELTYVGANFTIIASSNIYIYLPLIIR